MDTTDCEFPGEPWEHYIVKSLGKGFACKKCQKVHKDCSKLRELECVVPKPSVSKPPPTSTNDAPLGSLGVGASAAVVGTRMAQQYLKDHPEKVEVPPFEAGAPPCANSMPLPTSPQPKVVSNMPCSSGAGASGAAGSLEGGASALALHHGMHTGDIELQRLALQALEQEIELQELLAQEEAMELAELDRQILELELLDTEEDQLHKALQESMRDEPLQAALDESMKEPVVAEPRVESTVEPLAPKPPMRKRLRPLDSGYSKASTLKYAKGSLKADTDETIPVLAPESQEAYKAYWSQFRVATPQNHGRVREALPAKVLLCSPALSPLFMLRSILIFIFFRLFFGIYNSNRVRYVLATGGMDNMETLPMDADAIMYEKHPPAPTGSEADHPALPDAEADQPEVAKDSLVPTGSAGAAPEEIGSAEISRPEVLNDLKPVTPQEQRKLLPKAKAKSKASQKNLDVGDEAAKTRKGKASSSAEKVEDGETEPKKPARRGRPPKEDVSAPKKKGKPDAKAKAKTTKPKGKSGVDAVAAKEPGAKEPGAKAKKSEKARKQKDAGGVPVDPAGDEAAEKKKKASRRSSAYHCAYKKAKKDGLSDEDAKLAAKKALLST